ncbi:MAG: adenosylmethionine--8-amino-7-oxononanoate transaminase, partial [Arsenophonus sp. NC-QC1-MAG3]
MKLDDISFDAKHIWHPYTSMTQPLPTYSIVKASGVELELADGKKLI